jgi:hypothetical protein
MPTIGDKFKRMFLRAELMCRIYQISEIMRVLVNFFYVSLCNKFPLK